MGVDVLLGLQWGDEGKGKIVDFLAPDYDIVARFQGGPNAGHTLIIDGQKTVLHTVPSGIFQPDVINLIGNGVVIDPITLKKEIDALEALGVDVKSKLCIAKKAHLILPTHRLLDAASEAAKGKEKIGSTLRGIGPTYMDKTGRNGLRVGDVFDKAGLTRYYSLKEKHLGLLKLYPSVDFDLEGEEKRWLDAAEYLKTIKTVDGEYFINTALDDGRKVLAEGAQGTMLDIDFGTYPFVTSSSTTTAGVCTGIGIAPARINKVIGITKAYCTRVGSGPFPTELHDTDGERLRAAGHEFGATTGRPRRCGWIDIPQLRYAIMINGVTDLAITKVDVLSGFETIKLCTSYQSAAGSTTQLPFDMGTDFEPMYNTMPGWNEDIASFDTYEDLPDPTMHFLTKLQDQLRVPITYISTGPERNALIVRKGEAVTAEMQ